VGASSYSHTRTPHIYTHSRTRELSLSHSYALALTLALSLSLRLVVLVLVLRPLGMFCCTVCVGALLSQPLAIVCEEEGDVAAFADVQPSDDQPEAPPAPAAVAAPAPAAVAPAAPVAHVPVAGGRIIASPAARSLAVTNGVNLSTVVGTGPNGRIVKVDVLQGWCGGGDVFSFVSCILGLVSDVFDEMRDHSLKRGFVDVRQERFTFAFFCFFFFFSSSSSFA
jgi:e3 binding domain